MQFSLDSDFRRQKISLRLIWREKLTANLNLDNLCWLCYFSEMRKYLLKNAKISFRCVQKECHRGTKKPTLKPRKTENKMNRISDTEAAAGGDWLRMKTKTKT